MAKTKTKQLEIKFSITVPVDTDPRVADFMVPELRKHLEAALRDPVAYLAEQMKNK